MMRVASYHAIPGEKLISVTTINTAIPFPFPLRINSRRKNPSEKHFSSRQSMENAFASYSQFVLGHHIIKGLRQFQ